MDVLVEAHRLRKTFGSITAVDEISLKVAKGEVLGFLGPNGAGKSTTMKMLAGFLDPDSGWARICGKSVADQPKEAKATIGYLPEGAPAYGDMAVGTFLKFIAEIRGFKGGDLRDRIAASIARTGLHEVVDQRIETLSKGFKRRVGLAQAILHEPAVLIMDEPTDGLDPNQKHHVRSLIADMAKDKAIIVSTHILEEVEAVCTRAVVIDRGRIVADGTAEELQRRMPYHNAVSLELDAAQAEAAIAALSALPMVVKVERKQSVNGHAHLVAFSKNNAPIATEVAAALGRHSLAVAEMHVERGRLDEVFRQITTHEATSPNA